MVNHKVLVKRIVSYLLLFFPFMLIIAFGMHLNNRGDIFKISIERPVYDSDLFFQVLTETGGGAFIHSHALAYLSVPFMILTILALGYLLFKEKPVWSFLALGIGIFGTVFLAGFFASWISFSAVAKVEPQYYDGAREALKQLTARSGALLVITQLSYLSFIGLVLLCLGFLNTKILPKWSPISIILGCIVICLLMGLPNWMLLGSVFVFIGLIPVSNHFKSNEKIN